ncbi:MAG: OmpA family protein [Phycisphaera sp.]|nr:OmpA family protein [Phycisphaera sp.]
MSDEHANQHASHGPVGHGGHEEEEESGAPEWLISFADMVMLLMGFFVILFALNVQPKGGNPGGGGDEAEGVATQPQDIDPEFIEAVRRAFHNPLNPENPEDAELLDQIALRGAGSANSEGVAGAEREVRSPRDIDYFGQAVDIPFDRHQMDLSESSEKLIREFAQRNQGRQNVIEIRGHADEVEAFKNPEKAMQIALARATKVAAGLAESGIEWVRIRITASGTTEPRRSDRGIDIDPGENARVELLVRRESAMR